MSENEQGIQSRTSISTESCKFTWSIENFTLCGLQGEEYLSSALFKTTPSSLTEWGLRLYPNRNRTLKDGNVSVQLFRISADSSAHYARMKLNILDSNGVKRYNKPECCDLFDRSNSESGYLSFIKRSELFGSRLCLEQDTLRLMCELTTSRVNDYKGSSVSSKLSAPAVANSETLINDFQQLFDDQKYFDFTLKVGKEKFNVHKIILCARSSVFDTMLNCEMEEKLTNCVRITEFDPLTVKMMLRYIYCGKVEDLTPEIGFQLYSAAEKYNLQDLKTICVEYLLKNISVDNFCDVLILGNLHNDEKLMPAISKFFRANTALINKTKKWSVLSKKNPDLVIAMYESQFRMDIKPLSFS